MNNKQFYILILVLIVATLILWSIYSKLTKIDLAIEKQNNSTNNNFYQYNKTSILKLGRIEGNGNIFGDNNIENKLR